MSISWCEAKRRHGEITTAHLAALFGNLEYCRKLARIGAKSARCKISSKYTYGNQPVLPIDLAVATERPKTVRLTYEAPAMQCRPGLLSHAAPAFLFHKSWLDLTAPSMERVLYLLKTIIPLRDVNDWMNDNYWSLLHFAVSRSQEYRALRLAAAEFLLSHNAMTIAWTIDGNTPLHIAARANETSETVELLLRTDTEAQLNAVNGQGQTALNLAVGYRVRNRTKVSLSVIRSLLTASLNKSWFPALEFAKRSAKGAGYFESSNMLGILRCGGRPT